MQKLGQHFLKNTEVLTLIARTVAPGKGEAIVEIGPGHGELTMPLADAAAKVGGIVISIEKDHSLAEALDKQIKEEDMGLLSIIEGDALTLLPEITAKLGDYAIAGNIPYYITGKLLRVIGDLPKRPNRTILLIQKEVAERICAEPPAMNRLAASIQLWADPSVVAIVPRKDFTPPPDVESAVIMIKTKQADLSIAAPDYYRTVRALFAQPRKTILNNLSSARDITAKKEDIVGRLKAIDVDPSGRPQDLAISQIIAIAKAPLWG